VYELDKKEEIIDYLEKKMSKSRQEELRFSRTSTGPHRDSFEFLDSDSKIRLRSSRGQVKNMVFRLKMAEFYLLKKELGITPLILLDDIFAEMDRQRKKNLAGLLELGAQIFLASASKETDLCRFDDRGKKIFIENGRIR
jgi:DNA replication and repair protein RecF